jgi:hypothetical protein
MRLSIHGMQLVRCLALAAVLLGVVASLSPVLTPAVSATSCPEGYVLGPDTEVVNSDGSVTRIPGDCIPKPTLDESAGLLADLSGTPEAGGEEDGPRIANPDLLDDIAVGPTETPGGPGYVTVHKYDCQGEVDWATQSLDALRNQCGPLQGVAFDLVNAGPDGVVNYQDAAVTDGDGLAFWEIAQPGTVTITEMMPTGYGDPIVYCGVMTGLGNLSLMGSAGGVVSHPLAFDEQLYCDWFNIAVTQVEEPYPQAPGGAVYTTEKFSCVAGFDAYAADFDGLAANCSEPMAGVEFMVLQGDVVIRSGATDAAGAIDFGKVPALSLVTQEVVPEGYGAPIVVCASTPEGGEQDEFAPVTVESGNRFTYAFSAGEAVHCLWFNVPATGDAGEDDGSLTVIKLVCPPLGEVGETMLQAQAEQVFQLGPRKGDAPEGPEVELCSEFEATPGEGFTFDVTLDGQDLGSKSTDATGQEVWTGIGPGELVVTEQIPDGYGEPFFYCHAGRAPFVSEFTGTVTILQPGSDITCIVVNVPEEDGDGAVVVYKWECHEDPGAANDMPGHLEQFGCEPVDGIDFTLSYGIDTAITWPSGAEGTPGMVVWAGVPTGPVAVSEEVPAGYDAPVIYCASELSKTAKQLPAIAAYEGAQIDTGIEAGEILVCHWINIPGEGSSITIYKYTCPEGYDPYAGGANPEYDCTELTNGVQFDLHGDNYADVAVTGNYAPGDGAATWGMIPAGGYTIVETPPSGTQSAFVLRCEGNSIPKIQNFPLAAGYELSIETAPGDEVVCLWYNIPAPEWGSVTVVKYACATAHFVSPDDCEIYEGGVEFQLFHWTGAEGYVAGTGSTNSAGYLTWTGLDDGFYELEEVGREWCYAEASRSDPEGRIEVVTGKETTVWVYNCGIKTPLKQPIQYPNTGVGLASVAVELSAAPVGEQGDYQALPHNRMAGVLDSRIAVSMHGAPRPVRVAIESIGLDAEIEVLEIVDGAFQDPTTSDKVAWYKETGRPGMSGNMVLAGHLNYWGDPEGVFYALDRVQQGDVVEVTGQDGTVHRYEVVSVEQVEATAETLPEVAGPASETALTLITCGGQWDPGTQTYLHRTVVKAVEIA